MGVRDPLSRRTAQAGNQPDECADAPAARHQPYVRERVPHSLQHPADLSHLPVGDARSPNGEVDDLGDSEQPQCHRNQADAVEEVGLAECESQESRLRALAHRCQQEAEPSHEDALVQ